MENIKKELYCKLCFGTICDESCQVIDVTEKVSLNLLNLNVDVTEDDVICSDCSQNLSAAFNFKLMCLETEDNIFPYVHSAENLVEIKEIYVHVKDDKKLIDMLEDPKVCRLCLQLVNCEFKSVNEVDLDTVREYIPEINFISINNPILCKICFDSLCKHSTFLKNCQNLKKDVQNAQFKNSQCCIKTEEFEIKSDEDQHSNALPSPVNETDEKSNYECPREKIKNPSEVKVSKYNKHRKTCRSKHTLQPKDRSQAKIYRCDQCDYQANRRYNLMLHQVKHKDFSETELYKCDSCDFRTKQKRYLTYHQLNHQDRSTVKTYKCDECNYETVHKYNFTNHQLRHKDPSEVRMHKCDQCDYESKYKRRLRYHVLSHKDSLEVKIYKCQTCGYETRYKSNFDAHQLIHKDSSELKMYKCEMCDYATKFKSKLTRHQLNHKKPSQVRMYKCDRCSYEAKFMFVVRKHVLNKHKDQS